MKKRVLSVLLSLGLVIGMIPMTAKAETTEEESEKLQVRIDKNEQIFYI